MEQAVEQGLIKHIGLSNWVFGAMLIDTLNCANIPPAALQIEHHPYLVQPQLYLHHIQGILIVQNRTGKRTRPCNHRLRFLRSTILPGTGMEEGNRCKTPL